MLLIHKIIYFIDLFEMVNSWRKTKQWQLARKFSECEYSPKWPFSEIRETRQTRDIRRAVLRVLARLADIRQTVLRGLARLAKGEFGECYANLVNLASLANLASVG